MPSLAERREDVRLLVQHFLASIHPDLKAARSVSNAALDAITARNYPGNVRELAHTIERAALLADGPTVSVQDLAFERMLSAERTRIGPQTTLDEPSRSEPASEDGIEPFNPAKKSVIANFERGYLDRLLQRTGTNLSRAAALAGIDRHTLRDLLRRHGLRADEG
jgi:DNA-binding NtrC family response regulator